MQQSQTQKLKWEMDGDEIEAVLERIWDLHDKLSDAIHSISRTHFSKSLKNPENFKGYRNGFVFMKDCEKENAIAEAKSLNSIRCALENLEDQLEFFHTVQIQQRAERDTALARLEQSRLILALRLAEHHGKRYKVLDEAMDFIGDVRDTSSFVEPQILSYAHKRAYSSLTKNSSNQRPNFLVRVLLWGFGSTKKALQLDKVGGVLGNAALFALSMLALLHVHQVTSKDNGVLEISNKRDKRLTGQPVQLDVRMGRG